MMIEIGLAGLAGSVPWLSLILGFALTAAFIVLLTPWARTTGWVDKPSVRKSHEGEIPLVGGSAVLLAMLALQWGGPPDARAPAGFWVGALLLFVVALVDDRFPIRARYRFAVQCASGLAGVTMGGAMLPGVGDILGVGPITAWWIVMPVSLFGTVALVNAINFTDGADGLCGGLGFISLCWLLVAISIAEAAAVAASETAASHASSLIPLTTAMAGCLGGFLFFNLRSPWRRKASVFLGDGGSMLIGYTLAWLAIHATSAYGASSVSPVVCLWIVALPLADSASCFVRRMLAGETPMTADLKHLHHLVRRCGMTPAASVYAIHAGSLLCGFVGVYSWWLGIPERWMFAAFVSSLLVFIALTNLAWKRLEDSARVPSQVTA